MNTEARTRPTLPITSLALLTAIALALQSTGCAMIGDVFKAGAWVVFVVVAAIFAVGFGVFRIFAK